MTLFSSTLQTNMFGLIDNNALWFSCLVSNLDLSYYQIKFNSSLTGATWSGSTILVNQVSKPATSVSVPAQSGTYLIKAFDLTGNSSVNATSISTSVASVDTTLNNIVTNQQDPAFDGAKLDVIETLNETLNKIL